MTADPLEWLVGCEVDTISFVRDYVELRIDYSIVRALTEPTGVVEGIVWRFPAEGAADALRMYIGRTVQDVKLIEGDRLELRFDDDAVLRVSLRSEDRTGPEAVHVVPARADGTLDVAGMYVW